MLGKHTDYAGGQVLNCATDVGLVEVARPRRDAVISVRSNGQTVTVPLAVTASGDGGMATYIAAVARRLARHFPGIATGVDLANINFRYAIEGDRAPWRPLRAYDDGRQVFIEFPRGIGQGEMPPLFVVGPEGNTSELVNYRVRGNYMIVDRLFAAAELRFGAGDHQKRVRITRTDGRPAS